MKWLWLFRSILCVSRWGLSSDIDSASYWRCRCAGVWGNCNVSTKLGSHWVFWIGGRWVESPTFLLLQHLLVLSCEKLRKLVFPMSGRDVLHRTMTFCCAPLQTPLLRTFIAGLISAQSDWFSAWEKWLQKNHRVVQSAVKKVGISHNRARFSSKWCKSSLRRRERRYWEEDTQLLCHGSFLDPVLLQLLDSLDETLRHASGNWNDHLHF